MQIIAGFQGVQPSNVFAHIDQELSKPWSRPDAGAPDSDASGDSSGDSSTDASTDAGRHQ
jgi:hypothetical protein